MDLTWSRRSANVWVAGGYMITRKWLNDGKRGRVYEIRAPGRWEPVAVNNLAAAKQVCQIHAWMLGVRRQAQDAARRVAEEWLRELSRVVASAVEVLDSWSEVIGRTAVDSGDAEEAE